MHGKKIADATSGGLTGKKVLIVGAGPAGICAALRMAQIGAQVTVCEQRSQEEFAGTAKPSYIIVLQNRGLDALKKAGVSVQGTMDSRYCPHLHSMPACHC
jgi:2-polyprenyl-6-methoxyphenol hydroxylase-like FAD-dependent oxidoreductase